MKAATRCTLAFKSGESSKMNYVFTTPDGKMLGRADEQLNPIGKPFELLEQIPRALPVRMGSHRGDAFTEKSVMQEAGDEGYALAL